MPKNVIYHAEQTLAGIRRLERHIRTIDDESACHKSGRRLAETVVDAVTGWARTRDDATRDELLELIASTYRDWKADPESAEKAVRIALPAGEQWSDRLADRD